MTKKIESISYFLVTCHAVIPVLLFIISYAAFLYIQKTNSLRQSLTLMYDRINSLSGHREQIGMHFKALYGNMGKKGFIAHIADNLEYSGLTTRFAWLTPELYIVILIAESALVSIIAGIFSGKLYAGFFMAFTLWMLSEAVFSLLRNYRYRKEEEQLMAFVNSVESCAAQSDDIIYILEKAAGMIEGPLSEALTHTVAMIKSGIQGTVALRQLESRIEHGFFKTMIRNLEISSRNNANYREITAQCRKLLSEQLDNSKKLAQIYREAKIRLAIIMLCALVCLWMMAQTMLGMSLIDMFSMFSESFAGCCLIAMIAGTLMFTAYFVFVKGISGKN